MCACRKNLKCFRVACREKYVYKIRTFYDDRYLTDSIIEQVYSQFYTSVNILSKPKLSPYVITLVYRD